MTALRLPDERGQLRGSRRGPNVRRPRFFVAIQGWVRFAPTWGAVSPLCGFPSTGG
jgi:hypothetical protein